VTVSFQNCQNFCSKSGPRNGQYSRRRRHWLIAASMIDWSYLPWKKNYFNENADEKLVVSWNALLHTLG